MKLINSEKSFLIFVTVAVPSLLFLTIFPFGSASGQTTDQHTTRLIEAAKKEEKLLWQVQIII